MKRLLMASSALGLGLATGLGPAGAAGISTPLATQENVRHIATVPGNTGGHVVVEGNRLYMGNYGTGLSAYDITNPRSPVKIGQYLPGPSATDGADPGVRADAPPDAAFWNNRHIVSLGGTFRGANRVQTEFIDFTNPAAPQLLYRFAGSVTGGGNDGESHNGDIVDARKLWLPSGGSGNNGLRIYDMSPLLNTPPGAPVKLFSGNPHTLWNASRYKQEFAKPTGSAFDHTHDIEIYVDREILLPPWEWQDLDGDTVLDPTYAKRDIALLAAAGSGNAVYVIDITTPTAPVVISKWQNSGGNAIAYLHEAQFLHGDPNTIFVSDEDMTSGGCNEGRVYTFGVSDDLVHTTKLGEWALGEGAHGTRACAGAHVFSSHDRHVFMGAYVAGLQVIDMRDPTQPKRAGRYIAEGQNSWGALYHNGLVYTGDFGGRGLDVFEFIQEPTTKGLLKVGNPTSKMAVPGGGISEIAGACNPEAPTNDIDGLLVQIPADKRGEGHTIKAYGSGAPGAYDVDVYFWSQQCTYMGGILEEVGVIAGDAQGPIPEEAAFAYVDLSAGAPQWVYAKVT